MVCPHFVGGLIRLLSFPCAAKAQVLPVRMFPPIYWVGGLSP